METVLVDNEWLEAEQPDDFERVPHGELEAFMRFKYDLMWGVRDEAQRMLVCITQTGSAGDSRRAYEAILASLKVR